jgi:3-methyladenine DNA glycosylase/8-oxoguanine DNA glycosylase
VATSRSRSAAVALPFDPKHAIRHLSAGDPVLGSMIDSVGPFLLTLARAQSPFEALAESIVYQQLSGKAAATILSRVVAIYAPKRFPSPDDVLATPDESLRAAGLSGAKTRAMKDLAAKTKDGTVPTMRALLKMDEEAIVERLIAVRGIGRWTVEMMLIFRLGRPDVLPVGDYGIRKGFQRTFRTRELPTPKELGAHGERWRPFRTVASWYLWRCLELPDGSGKVVTSAGRSSRKKTKPRAK